MIPVNPELTFSDLPETIPVFPLTGVLLLPRAHLPLNIFEPRYLAMVRDALDRGDKLIGMIQPSDTRPGLEDPALYSIGCAGRIIESAETSDGRIVITLAGICRFEIASELDKTKGYRRVRADWAPYRQDFADDDDTIDRPRLAVALKRYFNLNGIEADWEALERTPTERLVSSIAMICPFDPSEKQALLEATDLKHRAETMIALIEMTTLDQGDASARH